MRRSLGFGLTLSLSLFTGMTGMTGCVDDMERVMARPSDGGLDDVPFTPAVACEDTEASIYADPGALPPENGAILKCSKGAELTKEQIQARLGGLGANVAVTSGARVFKVLYRTQRGNDAPGTSSAVVYVPTEPRGEQLPIVVGGRGTRGQAASCAVSKADVNAPTENDYARLVLPIVGNGFAMIVPDLAGYANFGAASNPPSAYAQAADVGRSTLDGSRALKRLFPTLTDTTVLVGHSQGGHNVLAALALAETYGAQGPIAGVAVYAPLWLSQRSWGAILDPAVALLFPIADALTPNAVSLFYHYTQAELLDGPGAGAQLFKPEKQAFAKSFVESACVGGFDALKAEGDYLWQLLDESFYNAVGKPAAFGDDCGGNATCTKWMARYGEDRPHLTGKAKTTPILMMYGSKDTTIAEDRMRCALDRLQADGTNLTVCVEPEATHGTILDMRAQHVASWIANLTMPGSALDLPGCPGDAAAIAKACATPPPND